MAVNDGTSTSKGPRTVPIRGEVVRSLRMQKGWSYATFAQKTGYSERTLKNIELIKNKPVFFETVETLAKALDVKPEELVVKLESLPEDHSRNTPAKVQVNITIDVNGDTLLTTHQIGSLLAELCRLISAKGDITIISTMRGSLILSVEMDEDDFLELVYAYYTFKITAIQGIKILEIESLGVLSDAARHKIFNEYEFRRLGKSFYSSVSMKFQKLDSGGLFLKNTARPHEAAAATTLDTLEALPENRIAPNSMPKDDNARLAPDLPPRPSLPPRTAPLSAKKPKSTRTNSWFMFFKDIISYALKWLLERK